jgi:transposase-like protein
MNCPPCQSQQAIKNGKHHLQDGAAMQNYLCKDCGKRFSERTGTPMARLRTPTSAVSIALQMRSEGMGVRASGRVLDKPTRQYCVGNSKLLNKKQTGRLRHLRGAM